MFISLAPATIGVKADLARSIDLAARHHFTGVDFSIREAADIADAQGIDTVRAMFDEAGVRPGIWMFPVNFRQDEATWQADLDELPRLAKTAAELGVLRTATYIIPGDDNRDYKANFNFHAKRLRPAAHILLDHDIVFGLEWVGTKEFRHRYKHHFIHTMEGMLGLCDSIGTPNMGLLVDIFHVENSYATADDVRQLRKEQVAFVHVNDGEAGVAPDDRMDNVRDLPGYTGELDINAFLHALRDIGYDGPVSAEPFSQRLRDMPDEEAVAETSGAMHRMWASAGLS